MNALEFVVCGALVPADFAEVVLADLALPAFSAMAKLASPLPVVAGQGESLLAPNEAWILRHEARANLALAWYLALGGDPGAPASARWMLEPVHLEVGHSQLVLADPALLALSPPESAALAEAARPILAEAGWQLLSMTPGRWFLGHAATVDLKSPSSALAIGENIALWQPEGDPSWLSRWRAVHNEIQMTWHTHPVNLERETAGRAPVNALWLSGNAAPVPARWPYSEVLSQDPLWSNLKRESTGGATLETSEALIGFERSEDWGSWRSALTEIDQKLGERIAALRSGRFASVELVLTGTTEIRRARLTRRDLWKFWRRGTLAALFARNAH
jgi:hypothetical protein